MLFENFLADMGERPVDTTLERINNNGNYEPQNCRWANATEQARNRRTSALLTAFGETKTLAAWAEDARCKVSRSTLWARIARGWSVEMALKEERTPTGCKKLAKV